MCEVGNSAFLAKLLEKSVRKCTEISEHSALHLGDTEQRWLWISEAVIFSLLWSSASRRQAAESLRGDLWGGRQEPWAVPPATSCLCAAATLALPHSEPTGQSLLSLPLQCFSLCRDRTFMMVCNEPLIEDKVYFQKEVFFSIYSASMYLRMVLCFSTFRLEHKAAFVCLNHSVIAPLTPGFMQVPVYNPVQSCTGPFERSLGLGERPRGRKKRMAWRPPRAKQIDAKNEFGGCWMTPLIFPTSCLIKLSHRAIFSKFLKDYLSGNPFKTLLKSKEMMFIGSAWTAKPPGLSGEALLWLRCPQHTGHWGCGRRKSLLPSPSWILFLNPGCGQSGTRNTGCDSFFWGGGN